MSKVNGPEHLAEIEDTQSRFTLVRWKEGVSVTMKLYDGDDIEKHMRLYEELCYQSDFIPGYGPDATPARRRKPNGR